MFNLLLFYFHYKEMRESKVHHHTEEDYLEVMIVREL